MERSTSVQDRCRGSDSSSPHRFRSRCCTPRSSTSSVATSEVNMSRFRKEYGMRFNTHIHSIALVALLLSPARLLYAQTVDPAGHYEGTVSSPAGEMTL